MIATEVITITTTTITTINTKTCIFVSLLLSGSMGSGNRTFDFLTVALARVVMVVGNCDCVWCLRNYYRRGQY